MSIKSKRRSKRSIDVISHGQVLVSDGHGRGQPARLELTHDTLCIQVPISEDQSDANILQCMRYVTIRRHPQSGLGIAVKGGVDVAPHMPVLISSINDTIDIIINAQQPKEVQQLIVGDAIVEVNGKSLDGKTHAQVVDTLKEAGDSVRLGVKHYTLMAPYVKRTESWSRSRSASQLVASPSSRAQRNASLNPRQPAGGQRMKSLLKGSAHDDQDSVASTLDSALTSITGTEKCSDQYKTIVKIPLPMAYLTTYLEGTDKQRSNAFELKAVDGSTTGVIHCEDSAAVDHWLKLIRQHIHMLNNKSIKLSNKYLHPSETIVYLGWVSERDPPGTEPDLACRWVPRFLILKGSDMCLYDSPPLDSQSLAECIHTYKIYETLCRQAKSADLKDRRMYSMIIEAATGGRHYISTEENTQLLDVMQQWQRATFYAVQRIQNRTFACNYYGRPSAFTIDLRQGFQLYDIQTKKYVWQYPLSWLRNSADDGCMRLQLIFRSHEQPAKTQNAKVTLQDSTGANTSTSLNKSNTSLAKSGNERQLIEMTDTKDIDCAELYPLIYTMHSFLLARVMGIDPDFVNDLK